jgi:purine-binding chemotaxis protein CheW
MTMIDDSLITDADEVQRILEERALALAQSTDEQDPGDTVTLVILRLGGERYGVPIEHVREIKPLDRVTSLSSTPPFWLGLANLRGSLYPVLDLRRYLGIPGASTAADPQLVLVAGSGMTIGLRVDEVLEVRSIQTSEIGPPLVERSADRADIHTGLTKDLIAVVDVEALLADRALVVQEGFDLS